MTSERMEQLLKIAVQHIENFEDTESENVLRELGFTKDELVELNTTITLDKNEERNLTMVNGWFIHNGEVIWNLSEAGFDFIFSDQIEDESSPVGYVTENIPFKNYSHYIYNNEFCDRKNGGNAYICYAWYDKNNSYISEFNDLDEALNWLVPEPEISEIKADKQNLDSQIEGAKEKQSTGPGKEITQHEKEKSL